MKRYLNQLVVQIFGFANRFPRASLMPCNTKGMVRCFLIGMALVVLLVGMPSQISGEEETPWYRDQQKLDMYNTQIDNVADLLNTALDPDAIGELADETSNLAGAEGSVAGYIGKTTNIIGNTIAIAKNLEMLYAMKIYPDSPVNSLRVIVGNIAGGIRAVDHLGAMLGPPGAVFSKTVIAFLKVYQAGLESAIRMMDEIGQDLGKLNRLAVEVAEIDFLLYPGAEAYSEMATNLIALRRMRPELRKAADASRELARKLELKKQKVIEFAEVKFPTWVKKVAAEVDKQILAGEYNSDVFAGLWDEIAGVIKTYEEYLGKGLIEEFREQAEKITPLANKIAEEGAEAGKLLKEAGEKLKEGKKILDACKKHGIDVAFYEKSQAKNEEEYEEAMKAMEIKTPSFIEAYHYFGLWDALQKHDIYGARLTAETIENRFKSIKELLSITAKLVRVTPTKKLISLPPKLPDQHEIPLKVKVLNVLGEPLARKHISFVGRGEVQVKPVAADTDKDGMVSATITVWKDIRKNPGGSSVEVYIIEEGKEVKLNYIFARAGEPASIVTISRPQTKGAPGAELPDPWVVEVKDKKGNTVDNIPLSVKFEALNGGDISPEKTTLSIKEGESVPVEEAEFSARLTLGPEDKKDYRFRVRVTKPPGHFFHEEITIQADVNSSYGKGEKVFPANLKFYERSARLAINEITSDITGYPLETSYSTRMDLLKVTRNECKHYKQVKDKDGKTKRVLDFSHPIDRLEKMRGLQPKEQPRITASPSGVVSIDMSNNKIKAKKVGRTELKATISGITGYKKTHRKCNQTIVKTGLAKSEPRSISVFGIKKVDYEYKEEDLFFPAGTQKFEWDIEVNASVTISDGLKKEKIECNRMFHYLRRKKEPVLYIDAQTDGNTSFAPDKDRPYAGHLKGIGTARVEAYLKDSKGKEHYRRDARVITLNTIEIKNPPPLPAGEVGEIKVIVKGEANMNKYYCQWYHKPHGLDQGKVKGRLFNKKTSFRRTGRNEWVSVNYISYPEDCVKPFSSGEIGDAWGVTINKKGEEPKTTNMWHSTSISPPRLNKFYLRAKRPNELGDVYTAFSFDLFADNTKLSETLLKILPVGIFGKNVESILRSSRWSLGGSPYKSPVDVCSYSLRSDEALVWLGLEHIKKEELLHLALTVKGIKRPAKTTISAMVSTALFSANSIDLTLNLIRIEYVKEGGKFFYRLIIDGPAEMYKYRTKWNLIFQDAPPLSKEREFFKAEDGYWASQIEEQEGLKTIEVEIIDLDELTIGKAMKYIVPMAKLDMRPMRDALIALFTAYEREDDHTFLSYISPEFRSVDDSGQSYGISQLGTSLLDDFRNLEDIEFSVDADPPIGSPNMARVDVRWDRRAILAISGQEWLLRDRTSILTFRYDDQNERYSLTSIQGDPIFGLSSPTGKIAIPGGSVVDGEMITEETTVDEGRIAGPTITSISPSSGEQGTTGLLAKIYGFNFQSDVMFSGTGIMVVKIEPISDSQLNVTIDIAQDAPPGGRDVTVINPDGQKDTLVHGFTVIAPGVTPPPTVTSAHPSSWHRDQTLDVKISGSHFQSGATVSFSGTGITIHTTTFVGSSRIRVHITIASDAPLGPRDITVSNPDLQQETGYGIFEVTSTAPPLTITSLSAEAAWQGYTASAVIYGSNFQSGVTVSFSGEGITVNSAEVLTSSQILVIFSIADGATPDARDVTVRNPDGEQVTADGAFTVLKKMVITSINPSSGKQGQTLDITISGENFRPGAVISFSGEGITVNTTTFVSPNEVQINITIALDANPARYQVMVQEERIQGFSDYRWFEVTPLW